MEVQFIPFIRLTILQKQHNFNKCKMQVHKVNKLELNSKFMTNIILLWEFKKEFLLILKIIMLIYWCKAQPQLLHNRTEILLISKIFNKIHTKTTTKACQILNSKVVSVVQLLTREWVRKIVSIFKQVL